jgi:hypothetical protein
MNMFGVPKYTVNTVVVSIALGDLALLVLRLARGAPLLHHSLVPVKNRLLRERRLGRDEVGALQLQRQEGVKVSRETQALRRSKLQQKQIRCIEKTSNSQLFLSLR